MRDGLLIILFPILLYFALKRPFLGLSLWLWSSLVPMQSYTFGPATSIRWNMVFALATIVGYLFSAHKPKFTSSSVFWLYLLFFLWLTVSCLTHNGFEMHVWDRYDRYVKASLFFLFAVLIVEKKHHIDALVWACVLSVGTRAAEQGIATILSGGGHVARGISNSFNDNNLAGLATLMCLPLMIYLFLQYKQYRLLKYGLMGGIALNIAFIFGTESRGAFLGLLVLGGFYFLKSNRKGMVLTVILAGSVVGLLLVDESWFNRMNTMDDLSDDQSFMHRVMSWKMHTLMALQDPLFGGGFDAASYWPQMLILRQDWDSLSFIESPYPDVGFAAHSIYFQLLGDVGFGGTTIYLLLLYSTYKGFRRIVKTSDVEMLCNVSLYASLSILSFLVAGAALSAAYNEFILMIVALYIGVLRCAKLEQKNVYNTHKSSSGAPGGKPNA